MHNPRCCRPSATSWVVHYTTSCNTQSSASEDGQNNCPKHVGLTGIINNPLLLHLVGWLYYLYQWCTVKQISENEIYFLIKYIESVLWRAVKRLSYIEDARCLKGNQLTFLCMGKNEFASVQVLEAFVKINFVYLKIFTLLWHCAAYCGNYLRTFRGKPSLSFLKFKKSKCWFGPEEKALRSFETLVATQPKAQRCIAECVRLKVEAITRYLIFVVPCIMLISEIIPRCNNCVYSSQWLYSTCFGWQFHPSSGVQCCIWPLR